MEKKRVRIYNKNFYALLLHQDRVYIFLWYTHVCASTYII